ncbi:2-C-methyl-D-erythritol 4-phosphate cytidylyltransferase [Candidatus Omnitrophota bacterium]
MKKKRVKALVLAAGYSQRIKSKVPKQLIKINRKPLLAYTLKVFERCSAIDSVILVTQPGLLDQCQRLVNRYRLAKVEQICLGGATRQQSVFNALSAIEDCDYLLIHDGVRPLVNQEIILRVVKELRRFNAVSCAVRAVDTIVEAKGAFLTKSLRRNQLWQIQTPQAFKLDWLIQAHRQARKEKIFNASDDAQLVLRYRGKVRLTEGSYLNLKVTHPLDLKLVKLLIKYQK